MRRYILLIIVAAFSVTVARAQQDVVAVSSTTMTTTSNDAALAESDIVESASAVESLQKTKFLPMRRRIDRQIDHNKFVYKGEVMLGLSASYGKVSVDDSELMLLFDNMNIGLNTMRVMPFVAYSYRNNRSVGMRFGYEYLKGELGNVELNLGSAADIAFSLSGVGIKNESFSWSVFHRNYLGLDRRGIIGAIIETELLVKTGTSNTYVAAAEEPTQSLSRNFSARLNFNPGIAVYVFPEVCVTVSVGIGGLYYNKVELVDTYDNVLGRRDRTGLQFKFNIADIQIGIVAHLWSKKRD